MYFYQKDAVALKGRGVKRVPTSNFKWASRPRLRPVLWFGNASLVLGNDTCRVHAGSALWGRKNSYQNSGSRITDVCPRKNLDFLTKFLTNF